MMQHCQFCESAFPDNARCCGNCGRAPASNGALDTASSPFASFPEASRHTVASTLLPVLATHGLRLCLLQQIGAFFADHHAGDARVDADHGRKDGCIGYSQAVNAFDAQF